MSNHHTVIQSRWIIFSCLSRSFGFFLYQMIWIKAYRNLKTFAQYIFHTPNRIRRLERTDIEKGSQSKPNCSVDKREKERERLKELTRLVCKFFSMCVLNILRYGCVLYACLGRILTKWMFEYFFFIKQAWETTVLNEMGYFF